MTVRRRLGITALLLAAGLAGTLPAPRATGEELKTSTVRIGLARTLFRDTPDALLQTMMMPFKSLMEAQTGLSGELMPGINPDDLGRQLKDDKLQLGVFNGFEFAWARQESPVLKPLMLAVNRKQELHAFVLVRDDSDAASLADLKGKTLAVPRRTREYCHLFLDRRCAAAGKAPNDYFGKLTTPGNMEDAVDAVVNGHADAVLIDGCFLAWYEERKPTRFARLKTVEKSQVFPAAVIAYCASAIDDTTLRRFRDGMLSAKDNPRGVRLMTLCQITSFEPVPDDYDKLLSDIAKAYPPPEKAKEKK